MDLESKEGPPVVRRPKLSARVVTALRSQLASGEIPPGKKLPTEQRLMQRFGVSRTVIREAIVALTADGLVQPRQGAGVYAIGSPAATIGSFAARMGTKLSTAINVLEVRLAIEVESAALAAERRSPAQEALIGETFLEFDRLLVMGEPTGPADLAFHRAIAVATGNPVYVEMLDALGKRAIPCDLTSPFSTEIKQSRDYHEGLQREHFAILRAISASDAEAARTAMRLHLTNSQTRYRGRLNARAASLQKDGR
jgi:GntR family transcriptional regulator, transcriptional repressor for pyruvate dehydrogenase complex